MQKPAMTEIIFFWILFLVAGAFTFLILAPYISSLFLALVLAIVFTPLKRRLTVWLGGRQGVASLLSVLLVTMLLLVPLSFSAVILFGEAVDTYALVTAQNVDGVRALDRLTHDIEAFVQRYVPAFTLSGDGDQYLGSVLAWIAQNLNFFFSGIVRFIFHIIIMLVALFFFFRDGEKIKDALIRWSPLSDKRDESILDRIGLAVGSVVKGSILVAFIQGALSGVGFYLFGVEHPALWALGATVAALIPPLGTMLTNIPAVLVLFATGHATAGVGLLLWVIAVMALADIYIRPALMRNGISTNIFVILLSVLGGLSLFGPIGFLAGPVIMAFFFALADLYPTITQGKAIPSVPPTEVA